MNKSQEYPLLIEERPIESVGHARLLASITDGDQFRLEVRLDRYQSRCFRRWLLARYEENSLQHSSVKQGQSGDLWIESRIQSESLSTAHAYFNDWVGGVSEKRED